MSMLRRIGIDILGVLLIIGAVLFGWLPGPGGIPMLLAGLGLLATNHEWARKLLDYLKTNGLKVANAFFREHPLLMLAYDLIAILLLAGATAVFIQLSGSLFRGLGTVMAFVGVGLFLGNRKRLQRLQRRIKRNKA